MARRVPRIGVVIAAGGKGKRLGSSVPKQFLTLGGVPILQRTVELFSSLPSVEEIVITSPNGYFSYVGKLLADSCNGKIVSIVPGGKERQESVWSGLQGFISKPDIVLVHDAVRPLVSKETVVSVIVQTVKYSAAVVGMRVQDTIKEEKKGFYARTLDRRRLWTVQTPQAFRFDLLVKAHRAARGVGYIGTDESSLLERLNIPVRIVEGDQRNIKITTRDDLRLAEFWLKKGR